MDERSDRLAALPDPFIACRALGHAWTVELGYGWTDGAGTTHRADGWERRACERCGTSQERHYDAFWQLVEARTTYPPGYVLAGTGLGHWRTEARAELFSRRAGPRPRVRAGRQRR